MTSSEFLVNFAEVAAESAAPSRSMLVLHGILGSGGNWRTIARRLAERCPSWSFVLVDLRAHGQSQGAPPPFTVDAAALDLVRLEGSLKLPVKGVMGHSFGGKVGLAYMRLRPGALEQAWVLDSSPSARSPDLRKGSAMDVLHTLELVDGPLPSRERFIEHVLARGHSRAIADWLAMNVRREGDGFQVRLDLKAIRALFEDYFEQDLWGELTDEGAARSIHVVLGGRSDSVPAADKARFEELARAGALELHVLPSAGHWLHADDPQGLLDVMAAGLGG